MHQQLQVMCFYVLDFYYRCYQAEPMGVTGWLLPKDSKLLYNIEQINF